MENNASPPSDSPVGITESLFEINRLNRTNQKRSGEITFFDCEQRPQITPRAFQTKDFANLLDVEVTPVGTPTASKPVSRIHFERFIVGAVLVVILTCILVTVIRAVERQQLLDDLRLIDQAMVEVANHLRSSR